MTIEQLIARSSELGSESARADVEYLLCAVLDCNRTYLRTWSDKLLSDSQLKRFEEMFAQRKAGRPIAHITGSRGFWTLELEVSDKTLIPRADTEVLVETAIELVNKDDARVLDLGTGTGAIALSLASENPDWQVVATDRISEAVELAKRNAAHLNITNVEVLEGSWFEPIRSAGKCSFDLIVSNPPYIDSADDHLEKGDLLFEPKSALVADEQGLKDLKEIVEQAPEFLSNGGWLLLEHGYDQASQIAELLEKRGFIDILMKEDFGGNPRVSGGRWTFPGDKAC